MSSIWQLLCRDTRPQIGRGGLCRSGGVYMTGEHARHAGVHDKHAAVRPQCGHLREVAIVQAADQHPLLAEPPPQQTTPCLVPNHPSSTCETACACVYDHSSGTSCSLMQRAIANLASWLAPDIHTATSKRMISRLARCWQLYQPQLISYLRCRVVHALKLAQGHGPVM